MDTTVRSRDLLGRVDFAMDKVIGRVVINGDVQIGKMLNVQQGYPVVHPYLRCLVVRRHLDGWNGEVRRNRVVRR